MKNLFFLFLFLFSSLFIFSEDYYKLAVASENSGKNDDAVKYYEEFLKTSTDKTLSEKVLLKAARLSSSYEKSVKLYNDFFSKYPDSKYRFIARYEIASIHKLNSNMKEAEKAYSYLIQNAKEKSYFSEKANINLAEIEIDTGRISLATERLSKLLSAVNDYEDSGKIYYLFGMALQKQGMTKEAEKYFLTCAGSFPLSSKSPTSLYQLVNIYLKAGKNKDALRMSILLNNLYSDSLESQKAKDLTAGIKENGDNKTLGIELIDLNKDVNIENNLNNLLRKDLKDSIIISENSSKENLEINYYIQLGYYSTKENAESMISGFQKNGAKDAFIARTRSPESKKIFFRIVVGPYSSKDKANQKILELKEKNIEALVLELGKYYE